MLFHLMKKDLLLVKNHLPVLLVFSVLAPLFISAKLPFESGGFLPLFTTVIFVEYLIYTSVAVIEEKTGGAVLLTAAPYTRAMLIKAKYLLIAAIFAAVLLIYGLMSVAAPTVLEPLGASACGWTLALVALGFGVLIPIQYRFGYERMKYIFMFPVFLTPFVAPALGRLLGPVGETIRSVFPEMVLGVLPFVLALLAGYCSMSLSADIYSQKDL
ncbi:MAG: transporter permease [Paenibacillaceae bacterium]|jgi:hypothetical protein|nr:transporter permease [Paenibacillaceae bacterium]